MTDFIWLIVALPAAGAVFLHFFGKRVGEPSSGWIASLLMSGAFVYALLAALPFFQGTGHAESVVLWSWMPAIGAEFAIRWDPLSSLMTLVVTGVGALIHFYAIAYMHGDPRFSRFFTYMNLFATGMLTLVLADNFAMLFLGWEAVGLCSYLLISFWFTKPSAAAAGKKAFIVNRIGDFGFMVALMIILTQFGTLSFEVLHDPQAGLSTGLATAVGLLMLVGAAGKSAQIPLYVWLPDAMEGPTPVSALIHAATMVTAGVYLVARNAAIYEMAPIAATTVATVGALTALWAATIALAQKDIKAVLAYSTVSQLGYMFIGVGSTAYVAGMFHFMTHAFFKALLFLGAGSVIHAMADEQNMDKMGGLGKHMPVTAATMGIATLAIAGVPPLAGFWSKDEILGAAFNQGGWMIVLWGIGLVTAGLTAFYMTRQFVLVFLGKPRWDEGVHPHESPKLMTFPLIALAGLTVAGGFVNTPFRTGLERYLEPAFETAEGAIHMAHPADGSTAWILAGAAVLAGLLGIYLAYRLYAGPEDRRERVLGRFARPIFAFENAYWVDKFYGKTIVLPGKTAADWAAFKFDLGFIDAIVNGVAGAVKRMGTVIRPLQTGFVRNYGVMLAAGSVGLLIWFLSRGGL